MPITLQKAFIEDCTLIHEMQVKSFRSLLEKYHDIDTNPGAEPLSRVVERMEQPFTHYYLILLDKVAVGAMRIIRRSDDVCRVSPIFVLPEFQGRGFAQEAMLLAESFYPCASVWQLDTILQEEKLCYLYEKLGYCKTGVTETIQQGMDIVYYEKLT